MSADILKEFVVAVGWKIDEEGARKVGEQIRTMTLGAVALGASLESLAATAFAATARISKTYSDIYFQSRKVGDSAGNIKAFSHAVSQLGGTAEEAGATLEEFSRKIGAGGPGQEKWLEQFIGQTRDAKGALRETSEMVDQFLHSKKFLTSPEYLQRRYIEMAGISENVWRASKDPNWQRHIEDAKKFNDAIGLDPQELAKKGQAFTEELRAIWMRIGAIRDKFLLNLGFEEPLKKFKKYLDEHSGDILKNLNAFVEAVKPFVIAFTNAAIQVGEFASAIANKLGPDTTAWVIIAGLGLKFTGMSTVITALATSVIPSLAGALGALMLGPSGVALRAISGIAALGGLMSYFNMDTSPEAMRRGHKNENWTGHKYDNAPTPGKESLWERGKRAWAERPGFLGGAGKINLSKKEAARESYNFWRSKGANHEQAIALVGDEQGESGFSQNVAGDAGASIGSFQWDAHRRAQILANTGIDVTKAGHLDNLKAAHWEMTQGDKQNRVWDKLMQAKDRGAALRTLVEDWERSKHQEADIAKRLTHANAWERAFSEQATGADKDISAKANYSKGMIDDPQGFIVHHTGGRGTAEGVVNTLNQRGLGVQFVIDRDGNIVRTLPEGARGAHILPSKINGLSNANAIGVEVVAKDDKDVTDKQIAAVKKLYEDQARKYPGIRGNVFGHGEVNPGHKQATEGMSSVEAIRADREMQARLEGQKSPESKKWANIIGSARAAQLYDKNPQASPPRPIGHTITNHSFGDTILNQKTSINVQTPGDAGAAAKSIAGVQSRVNADAIRNMQGAAH